MATESLAAILIIAIFLAHIIEFALLHKWFRVYYRQAIPLLSAKFYMHDVNFSEQIPILEKKLTRTTWRPPTIFKQLSSHEFAFRHQHYTRNVVFGLIQIDPSDGSVIIKGYLFGSFLIFATLASLILAFFDATFIFPVALFIILGGINALIQWRNYSQIAEIIYMTISKEGKIA